MSANTAATFSSFGKPVVSTIKPPFGSKDLRFDGKIELKEYFNREPGPGTYENKAETFEQGTNELMDRLKGLDGKLIDMGFTSLEKRFKPNAEMLSCDPNIDVGPG